MKEYWLISLGEEAVQKNLEENYTNNRKVLEVILEFNSINEEKAFFENKDIIDILLCSEIWILKIFLVKFPEAKNSEKFLKLAWVEKIKSILINTKVPSIFEIWLEQEEVRSLITNVLNLEKFDLLKEHISNIIALFTKTWENNTTNIDNIINFIASNLLNTKVNLLNEEIEAEELIDIIKEALEYNKINTVDTVVTPLVITQAIFHFIK